MIFLHELEIKMNQSSDYIVSVWLVCKSRTQNVIDTKWKNKFQFLFWFANLLIWKCKMSTEATSHYQTYWEEQQWHNDGLWLEMVGRCAKLSWFAQSIMPDTRKTTLERDGGDSVTTLGRMMAGLLYKDIYLWMWLDDMSMTWLVWCVLWLNHWVTFWKFPNLPFASYNEYTGTFVLVPWQHCKFNLKCMYIA